MNELRMYVERLFEGKVLTQETIELKEEIYGNLVARYEDYVASGMSEAEALEKTKASITSIEDVLAGQSDAADAASGETKTASAEPANTETSEDATRVMDATQTRVMPQAAQAPEAPESLETPETSESQDPQDETAPTSTTQTTRKRWPYVVGIIAAVFLLGIVGRVVIGAVNLLTDASNIQTSEQVLTSQAETSDASSSNSATTDNTDSATTDSTNTDSTTTTTTDGLPTDGRLYDIYVDTNGRLCYDDELADDLIYAIVESSYTDVASYVGTSLSDTATATSFVSSLPMGEWLSILNASSTSNAMTLSYEAVPHYYDGDSQEAALAYNVTAILCAMSDVSRIEVLISESDEPYDYDYYVFDRTVVETLYGISLTRDLVSEAGWQQLKVDNLYTRNFIDTMINRTER